MITPVRKLFGRWGIILAIIVILLFLKLVVVELHYWGPHATVQDTDFVNVWAAGRMALDGHAAQAYDWSIHRRAEVAALGHDLPGYYGWHYPPIFFFVAALLALVPYIYGWMLWGGVTLFFYLRMMRQLFGEGVGYLLALAWPPVAWNAYLGQNGLLTATLLGGALYHLDKRPRLAGVYLGLLTYKPQLGLILPFVLLVERRWQTILSAMITASIVIAASMLVFGSASWEAFVHWMPYTSSQVFEYGHADLSKMQSLLGILRSIGVGLSLSWGIHAGWMMVVIGAVIVFRRHSQSFEIKAAALALATLIASPYLYIYDLAALSVPLAFLLVLALRQEELPRRCIVLLLIIILSTLLFPVTGITIQFGFLAMVCTGVMIYWQEQAVRQPLPHPQT